MTEEELCAIEMELEARGYLPKVDALALIQGFEDLKDQHRDALFEIEELKRDLKEHGS